MKEFIEKLIGRLEEKIKEKTNDDMSYKIPYFGLEIALNIVNQLAEEYKPCNKPSCKDCEVYDKEKHYCPKWCDVIKHTTSELAEKYNNGWIACSERLPEDGQEVLLSTDDFAVYQGVMKNGGFSVWEEGWIDIKYVLAWQPLPAPYQPDHK